AAQEGEWRAAGGSRRRRRRGRAGREEGEEEESSSRIVRRLREARDDLLSCGFWEASAGASVRALLDGSTDPPTRCVCYGLGRFSTSPAARDQLAFLLLLLEELQVPPGQCALFDPVFSAQEVAVLGQLGLQLLSDNEEGKHGVEGLATLFYMVHCGKALYNNLLWRNWSAEALSKMVIIGNSFKGTEERLLPRILERDYSYIAKVLKATEEVALPDHPRYQDTFNDTSVHWFPVQKLKELSPEVWNFVEEPTYPDCDDVEIIRKEDRAGGCSPAAVGS
ncbi:SRR1L protein, partial [Piaya cayana]|nr:SRR1L protein [Piaya cayana]